MASETDLLPELHERDAYGSAEVQALCEGMAPHLPPGWTVSPCVPQYSQCADGMLLGPHGQGLTLGHSWRDPARIEVATWFPRRLPAHRLTERDLKGLSITVAAAGDPQRVAQSIGRRLIGRYGEVWGQLEQRAAEDEARRQRYRDEQQPLFEALGRAQPALRPPEGELHCVRLGVYWQSRATVAWQDGWSSELRLSLPPMLAREVLSLVRARVHACDRQVAALPDETRQAWSGGAGELAWQQVYAAEPDAAAALEAMARTVAEDMPALRAAALELAREAELAHRGCEDPRCMVCPRVAAVKTLLAGYRDD